MITTEQIQIQIAEAIKYSGKTQTEIATALGVTQQMISQYIHGAAFPSLETFANFCQILDLDANEILCIKK